MLEQVDSMHSAIEHEVKNKTVWAPSQWITRMIDARQKPFPYEVAWLTYDLFIDWKSVAAQLPLKNLIDADGQPVRWTSVRQIKVGC